MIDWFKERERERGRLKKKYRERKRGGKKWKSKLEMAFVGEEREQECGEKIFSGMSGVTKFANKILPRK